MGLEGPLRSRPQRDLHPRRGGFKVIERVWLRRLVTTLVLVGATWLNFKLQPARDGHAPLLPYFPALVIVGLTCGLGSALMLLLVLFLCAGMLVSVVSAWAGRLMNKERLIRRRLNLALAAGRMVTWDVATGFATTAGGTFHLLTSLRPVKDADGQVRRALGATVDVTELTAAQEQLHHENQGKDAFLATLAHELRNPMAPIRYAVTMLQQTRSDDIGQRATAIIARQSAHMARLLDDLLDMSRITRNVIELKRQSIDVRGMVRQALEAVEPLYGELQQRVSLLMPPEPVMVDGDPTRLQQVLSNLLDNAAKYSPTPGEVLLDIGLPGLSGLEVARRLRAMSCGEPQTLIAITGWGQHADREATADAGFDAHLVKPIEFDDLDRTLQRLLHAQTL
jgi:signal transduction histidine kinase